MKLHVFFGFVLILIAGFTSCKKSEERSLKLPVLFTDGMVLQRNTEVSFWGTSSTNKEVTIEAGWGKNVSTEADEFGRWSLKIPTTEAGGPFEIKITCGDSILQIKNVLLGEVWLASGQSNMEMPLLGWPPNDTINNSQQEIDSANYNEIRMFTVTKAVSFEPLDSLSGSWQVATKEHVGNFSATAYFFAREIHKTLKVPVGIIHSSWGGTPAESWISKKSLATQPDFTEFVQLLEQSIPKLKEMQDWLHKLPSLEVKSDADGNSWSLLNFEDRIFASETFNDADWKTEIMPKSFETSEIGHFDGNVWFRKVVEIPQAWLSGEVVLELGPIDDMDATYVNGVKVGGYEEGGFWQQNRIYTIPKNVLKAGKNLIAVRVMDTQGGGGIYGKPEQLNLYPKNKQKQAISLAGEWKYLPTAEYQNGKFYLFNKENNGYYLRPNVPLQNTAYTATCLYNAMIAPLIPYTIKGAIWYQGESNVGRAEQYSRIFPLLIQNWRSDWKPGNFPFYYAQIAPFVYGEGAKSEEIREAQRLTLGIENTGMAVTMDIGNVNNIHPGKKADVGKRLALWALAKEYGQPVVFSGPNFNGIKVESEKAVLSFDFTGSGLQAGSKGLTGFEIAGEDGVFKPAVAQIEGDKVVVTSAEVKSPKTVRYAWSDTAEASLFNKEGLPASSFCSAKVW